MFPDSTAMKLALDEKNAGESKACLQLASNPPGFPERE